MKEQLLVSVIVPTYNRPGALCELLEALSRQTYSHMHIYIVNDAGEPVDAVVELYPELTVTVLNMERNARHVHARNRALAEVKSEYIMLCDDDDLLLPTHLETMLEAIADYDLVYSDVEIFDYEVVNGTRRATKRFVFAYESDLAAMRTFSTFVSSGCLYRASLHERLGPFDAELYNYWDWDFYLRVAQHDRVRRVPVASALYAYGETGDNISREVDAPPRRHYLDKLCEKHGLGELPSANFFTLLEEPDMRARRAETTVLWDGEPFVSRLALAYDRKED
ncbi:glycosyltransferase family 2 protein [Paenibacillus sp. YYML68]|uniref:glycosyltransferase family 2 protein n=1 Tax=Paenibacillus sp. YYML68 TaxID=2909250 RepID=UPI002491C6EE|nr:glycosyltransferase family 2 protein [Paenibacillus sp. YYML68]